MDNAKIQIECQIRCQNICEMKCHYESEHMSYLKCQNICFAVLPVISMLCEIDFKEASDRMYQNVLYQA